MEFESTLGPWLGRTMKIADFFFQEAFKNEGIEITKNQWIVLKKLVEADGRPQNELAFITNRDKTSLTRLLSTMESKKLVKRVSCKNDKRIKHIHITSYGKDLYVETIPVVNEILETIQYQLTEKEIKTVIEVMKKIQKNLTRDITATKTI